MAPSWFYKEHLYFRVSHVNLRLNKKNLNIYGVWITISEFLFSILKKLTIIKRHLFSMRAPQKPQKPTTRMTAPETIHSVVALRKPTLGNRSMYSPRLILIQIPTDNTPHPSNWNRNRSSIGCDFKVKSHMIFLIETKIHCTLQCSDS